MDEAGVKRAKSKKKLLRRKGWYVPSLHGKALSKATVEDTSEEGR